MKHSILATVLLLSLPAGLVASDGGEIVLSPDSDIRIREVGPFENAHDAA